jgi:predicted HTH domain antitoxin
VQREETVQPTQRVRKTDNNLLRGQTAVVESHGRAEVAIMDIVDYRITRAVMRYYAQRLEIDAERGLADQELAGAADPQARYDLVLAHYLAGAISLGRAAELLELPWLNLRSRLLRLDVPIRAAPGDLGQAQADVEQAQGW